MLAMIWAQARGGAMGKDDALPWDVPEDMALFKRITYGHAVIMGRKTWESLDPRWRPLPGRRNYVVTRDDSYEAPGAHIAHSLEEAYELASTDTQELVWLIGGAELLAHAITSGLAEGAIVTDINLAVLGASTFAPGVPFNWEILESDPGRGWHRSCKNDIKYRFTVYRRPDSTFGDDDQEMLQKS